MPNATHMLALRDLVCTRCNLTGNLSTLTWAGMFGLQRISLAHNNLTGMSTLGGMQVRVLELSGNPLGVSLPMGVVQPGSIMARMSLSGCQLHGPLPSGAWRRHVLERAHFWQTHALPLTHCRCSLARPCHAQTGACSASRTWTCPATS
jgi:hypothetical protein